MNCKMGRKIFTRAFRQWLRRGMAAALAGAIALPFLPLSSLAVSSPLTPPSQVTDTSEFPKIELKLNIVRTEYGTLNNTAELSLCVGPSKEGKPVTFRTLATTLQYNTELFQAIDWTWVADLAPGTAAPTPFSLSAANYYDVQIPAMKDDTLPGTGAIAQCGVVTPAPTDISANVGDGSQALLFFKAESYDGPITLTEMKTLAVVRFYVNPTLMNHLSIERNKDGKTYTLFSDALEKEENEKDKPVPDVKTLNTAVGRLTEASRTASNTALADGETALDLPEDFTAVGFALDGDIALSRSPAYGALHYDSEDNEFYFVPGDMLADTAADASGTVDVTIKGKEYQLKVPATQNTESMVLAVGEDTSGGTPIPTYSYITNLIPPANITFPVVSEMSFADKGVDLDRYAVLVFADWDNTLLGTLVVPKYENVASIVNEYIAENFVHKDLRTPDAAKMASTARADTYRGKYPYSEPKPDGYTGSEVVIEKDSDGNEYIPAESYPLTNKLDYAFLRRPMERATNDDGTLTTDNTWVQKLDRDGNTYYDTDFPYAYGWAKCTADNYVDTWTTLGSNGELNSYAVTGGAAAVTSTDKNFVIADLVKGFGKDDSTVFLKAIYEPGDSLMDVSFQYRLCTEPTYNKYNELAADSGGAFSVSVQYERASTQLTNLRGVPRTREPMIRQQTTSDLRWESVLDLGVDHNLPNASLEEAASWRTKTTYTRVQVVNSEILDVELALSARQNKVDYYLIDAHQSNFVAGDERSDSNFNREDATVSTGANGNTGDFVTGKADFSVDNYNYYVSGESEARDPNGFYFDVVQYEDKNGSQGFVLYGTLNNLLQESTRYSLSAKTEEDEERFMTYVNAGALADANLRLDVNGSIEPDDTNVLDFQDKLLKAAEAAYAHRGDPDYWDNRLDCARLSYHQLQWFIIDDTNLLDPGTAENNSHLLGFCHLHAACAATTSMKPKTWTELIDAALDTSLQPNIDGLTLAEIESLSHLRAAANGDAFGSTSEFKNALIRATTSLGLAGRPLTWENIQYAILHPAFNSSNGGPAAVYPVATETATYWWYDGATSADIDGWEKLITAVDHAIMADYPDGTSKPSNAKIGHLEPAFTAGFSSRAWITATENLASSYNATTDTPSLTDSFATFRDALIAARRSVPGNVSWEDIQHALLKETPQAEYWWHNGGFKVIDIETMLRAASDPTSNAWTQFTYNDLYNRPGLQFRKSFAGEKYTPAEFADFKDKVLDYLGEENARTNNWAHFQYYLLYDIIITDDSALSWDSAYYWWENGNEPAALDFTFSPTAGNEARANALARILSNAAYRSMYNGNTNAYNNLTAAILESGRMVAENNADTFAGQTKITDVSAFVTLLENTMSAKVGSTFVPAPVPTVLPSLTWEEIQTAVLGKAPDESSGGFWWKIEEKKPTQQNDPQDDFNTLSGLVEAVANAVTYGTGDVDTTVAALRAFLTEDVAGNMGFIGVDRKSPVTRGELDAIQWDIIKYDYNDIDYGAALWGFDNTEPFRLTWYQIQEAILLASDGLMDDEEFARDTVLEEIPSNRIPAWVTGASGASLLINSFMKVPQGADVEVDPETGLITTTSPDAITELPGGLVQFQRTTTVLSPEGQILSVTTLIEIYDTDYNLVSSQTITMPVADPEAPVCTCGSEDGVHAQDCPLYAGTDDPIGPACTCGGEDGVHTQDCPLYAGTDDPIGPACTCGSEDGVHTQDCPLYTGTDDPIGPACTCGSEDGVHAQDCPLYVGADDPVGPACTCGSEDGVHTQDCPLYVGTDDPIGLTCTCGTENGVHAENCPLYTPSEEDLTDPIIPNSGSPDVTDPPVGADDPVGPGPTPDTDDLVDQDPAVGAGDPIGPSSTVGTDALTGPSETETVAIGLPFSLNTIQRFRSYSPVRVYRRLTTKIVTPGGGPTESPTKPLVSAGEMRMRQLTIQKHIGPPGQPWLVSLLLRTDAVERRCAV